MPLEFLSEEKNVGYGPLPIPNGRDGEIGDALRIWLSFSAAERSVAMKEFSSQKYYRTLECYSERMACLAVRTRDSELIFLGTLALGIHGWLEPWGIKVETLVLHYDASKRIGASAEDVFEKAAAVLPNRAAADIRLFLKRPENSRTIECMRFHTGVDRDGFRYVKDW